MAVRIIQPFPIFYHGAIMKILIVHYALILPLLLCQSCSNNHDEEKQPAAAVASIGTDVITTDELTMALREFPPSNQFEYLTEEGKRMLVEMMIDWKLMSKEAVKTGLDKDKAIKTKLIRKMDGCIINEQVLSNAYLHYRIKQMEHITDTEIEQYFVSHINEFCIPERVKVKRIIFEAKDKAQEALAEFSRGLSFEEFKQHNPKIRTKIDTLWLERTEAGSEMERVAFSLREEAISDILPAQKGCYILRIEEKSPGRTQSFDEIKVSLGARLQQEREQQLVVAIIKNLRAQVRIAVHEEILRNYRCEECGKGKGGRP